MIDILTYIHGRRKTSAKGWISFNAPCCTYNGETPDKKMRGSIKYANATDWTYHCFNCKFKASFKLGYQLSFKVRKLMSWMGVPDYEIKKANLESLRNRNVNAILDERKQPKKEVSFNEIELSAEARMLEESDTEIVSYLAGRGLDYQSYPFMIDDEKVRPGVLIPYTYQNKLVGHTTRFLTDRTPKFLNEQQPGYVFGIDLQKESWQVAIVCEGIIDAISLDILGLLHNEISDEQVDVIRRLQKRVIVVPDQDKAGLPLIDRAIELGFGVSIPDWGLNAEGEQIHDINEAVVNYGKLATLISIVKSANHSKLKIELAKRKLKRKIAVA